MISGIPESSMTACRIALSTPTTFPAWAARGRWRVPDTGDYAMPSALMKELGALGVQIYTNVAGKPLDHRSSSRSGRR